MSLNFFYYITRRLTSSPLWRNILSLDSTEHLNSDRLSGFPRVKYCLKMKWKVYIKNTRKHSVGFPLLLQSDSYLIYAAWEARKWRAVSLYAFPCYSRQQCLPPYKGLLSPILMDKGFFLNYKCPKKGGGVIVKYKSLWRNLEETCYYKGWPNIYPLWWEKW